MRHAAGLSAEDRLDLSDLVHRYGAFVDAGLVDDVVNLFTVDAVMLVPEPPRTLTPDLERPRERIHEAMAALAGLISSFHEVVGEVYDGGSVDDTARGTVKTVAHHVVAAAVSGESGAADDGTGLIDVVWRATYADDYRHTSDGWRFSRRELTIELIEQRPITAARRRRP